MDEREVFISYHTDSSKDTVKKICAALEGADISCWYAPRDVRDNYAHSIVQAIRNCKIFLLLLNEQSNMSAHVLNELNCAFDRFKNHEDITLLPFRIDECTLSDDVYYYLGRIHIMDGSLPPEVLRIQELVERISLLLGKKPERILVTRDEDDGLGTTGAKESQEKVYRITGSVVYPDTRFIGREKELQQIHTQMADIENKLFLVGMGGIGKSEIAKMYLKRYASDYDVILWVPFQDSLQQTVTDDSAFQIQGMCRADYPEDNERDYFKRKLMILRQIADRRVLIVIDNFDVSEDQDLEEFCAGTYSVLFTTRYHQECSSLPELNISGMNTPDELMALFRAEYTRALDYESEEAVRNILVQLDGHPLSIRLVASAMQSRRISPGKMLELLKTGASGMAMQNVRAADIIFGRLRQVFQLATLSEDEQYLLKNLSLVSMRGITVERLFDWCGLEDFDIIDGLIRKSWVIYNPVTDEVHLHPLVADLMAEALAKDPDCCEQFIDHLAEACNITLHDSWEYKLMLNDYANTACERLPQDHPKCSAALESQAKLTMDMSMYGQSAIMFRQLIDRTETLGKKLELYHKLAHALVLGGEAEDAKNAALEGCALVEGIPLVQLSNEEGYYYNELMRRLTEACIELGEYTQAVEYARKALSFCDMFRITDPNVNRGWVEFHLARALYYHGEIAEAEKWIRHAIILFEEINDTWSANYSYAVLGQILMVQEQYEEALKLNQKSYEILVPYYGTEHVDIAMNLERGGNIYLAMGDIQKAKACYSQAAEIFESHHCMKKAERVRNRLL